MTHGWNKQQTWSTFVSPWSMIHNTHTHHSSIWLNVHFGNKDTMQINLTWTEILLQSLYGGDQLLLLCRHVRSFILEICTMYMELDTVWKWNEQRWSYLLLIWARSIFICRLYSSSISLRRSMSLDEIRRKKKRRKRWSVRGETSNNSQVRRWKNITN